MKCSGQTNKDRTYIHLFVLYQSQYSCTRNTLEQNNKMHVKYNCILNHNSIWTQKKHELICLRWTGSNVSIHRFKCIYYQALGFLTVGAHQLVHIGENKSWVASRSNDTLRPPLLTYPKEWTSSTAESTSLVNNNNQTIKARWKNKIIIQCATQVR